jgi:hypothetical protein
MRPSHCPYCDCEMSYKPVVKHETFASNQATRDHIVPRCKGGTGSKSNPWATVFVCFACNQDKGSLTLNEWRAALSWRHRRLWMFAFEWRALKTMPRCVAYHLGTLARLVTC